MKRLFALILAMIMVWSMLPLGALAAKDETFPAAEPTAVIESTPETEMETESETEPETETETKPVEVTELASAVESFEIPFTVNPIYEGIYTEADFPRREKADSVPGAPDHSDKDFWQDQELLYAANYLTVEEAAKQLKQHMLNRDETFTLYFKAKTNDYNEHLAQILMSAVKHTGKPKEGDYLQWHYAGWGGYVDYFWENGECCFVFDAQLAYSTTAAQEKELDKAVSNLLSSLSLSGKSEYQKIKAVYDYVCQNITYDYENLEDETYLLKHSAYAALVNKTAVCQGYATLIYRLLLELGVDVRVIPGLDEQGVGHAWNIVRIGDVYYNLDATWDAGSDKYYYFLRNTLNFPYHYRYMEYATTQFHTDYPMAQEDYVDGVPGVSDQYIVIGVCGDEVAFAIDRQRNLIIAGNGPMWDYESITSSNEANYPPWYYWMDAFERVIIEEGVTTIGNNAFHKMSHITSVTLPDTLLEIGDFAFEYLSEVDSVTLPPALETIGTNAFSRCAKLTEITIPDSLKTIGDGAFFACGALAKATFGKSVETVGDRAFQYTNLTEAILPAGVLTLGDYVFGSCTQLQKVEFGSSLKTIGINAFEYCRALGKITLPDTLTEIGDCAFLSTGIQEVVLPDSVKMLGREVFWLCSQLQYAKLSNAIKDIPYGTFRDCSMLATVEIANDITTIGMDAFSGTALEEFVFPDTVTSIGIQAFQKTNLKEVVIPAGVTILESLVFDGCANLERVELNNVLENIKNGAFSGCSKLTDIVIPDSVTSIGQGALCNCTSLTNVNIPDGITSLAVNLFSGCENLDSITIPAGVTSIGSGAFNGCKKLKSIDIPNGVSDIGPSAFARCAGIRSFVIPASVIDIGYDAFSYCDALEEIIFLGDAPRFAVAIWDNPVFREVTATAYYPIGNETWTEDVLRDYEGTITWIAQCASHEFTDVQVVEPTCTENGYTRHACPVCQQSYTTDETEKLGHDLPEWVVEVKETCTTEGSRNRTCQREGCDYSESEVIPAAGHDHVPTIAAPTCTVDGYTTHTCHCGDTYVTDEVPALGHSVAYGLTTTPTLDTEGAVSGVCSVCAETLTQILPKLNKEDYTCTVLKAPTIEETGAAKYTWNVADYGEFVFEVVLEKLPPFVYGDTDGNGKIQTNDAKLVLQHIVRMPVELNLDAADVDGNGKIQTNDAKLILQYIVKIITQFPAEKAESSDGWGENQTPPAVRG